MRRPIAILSAPGLVTSWALVCGACGAFGADDPPAPLPDASPNVDANGADAPTSPDAASVDAAGDAPGDALPISCAALACAPMSNPCLSFGATWTHLGVGIGKALGAGFQTFSDGSNSSTYSPATMSLPAGWTFRLEMDVGASGTATIARISANATSFLTIQGGSFGYRACVSSPTTGERCTVAIPRPSDAVTKRRVRLSGTLSEASADLTLEVGCGAAKVSESIMSPGAGFVTAGGGSGTLDLELGVMAPGTAARTDVDDLRFGIVVQ